jgi:hypothetical protein
MFIAATLIIALVSIDTFSASGIGITVAVSVWAAVIAM